jgi:hypothetical protein
LAENQPVISVDTKKKELAGDFTNAGREWRPRVLGGFHVVHGTFETADDYTFKPCEAFCEARSPLE